MAGSGWRTFTAGAVLTAAQVQNYLQDQAVQVYASAAGRTAALGTAVSTGMVSYRTDGTAVEFYNGSSWVGLADASTAQTLTNKTLTAPVLSSPIFNGSAAETWYQSGTAFAGYTFYAGTNGALQFLNSAATSNGAVNITWSSGTTLNSQLATNQSISVTMVIVQGATAYYPTSITIDGSAPAGIKWLGGSAPTSGNAGAWDIYTFEIAKLGSPNWYVLASQTKFA